MLSINKNIYKFVYREWSRTVSLILIRWADVCEDRMCVCFKFNELKEEVKAIHL